MEMALCYDRISLDHQNWPHFGTLLAKCELAALNRCNAYSWCALLVSYCCKIGRVVAILLVNASVRCTMQILRCVSGRVFIGASGLLCRIAAHINGVGGGSDAAEHAVSRRQAQQTFTSKIKYRHRPQCHLGYVTRRSLARQPVCSYAGGAARGIGVGDGSDAAEHAASRRQAPSSGGAKSVQPSRGICMSLGSGEAIQSDGLSSVLRNTLTVLKHAAQVELS